MVGIFSSIMLAGLLTADPSGVNFQGPKVTARTTGGTGYFTQGALPFTDLFERGRGSADFSVQDRVTAQRATYGDVGRLDATFTLGAVTYRVELTQAGFPPAAAREAHQSGPLPPPPGQPISGGVALDLDIHGGAPVGAPNMTREHAAAALWGVGRLWRNGQLISDTALIHAAALERGAHADDDTFRVLPVARAGDTELDVLVWNLPQSAEPRGFVQFDFDDVAIERDGVPFPMVAVVPNAGVFYGVGPANSPVVGGAALGSVSIINNPQPSTQPQQGTGGSGTASSSLNIAASGDPTVFPQQLPQSFVNEGSASLSAPISGNTALPAVPQGFLNSERTGTGNMNPGTVNGNTLGTISGNSTGTTTVNSTGMGTTTGGITTTTNTSVISGTGTTSTPQTTASSGSYTILPQAQVAGPSFAFGGTWVAPSIISTPTPGNSLAAVPLVGSPQPLNGAAAVPLIASPQPLNVQGVQPLVQGVQPLSVQPLFVAPTSAATATPPGFR